MEVKKDKTKVSLAEAFPEVAKEWHPTKNGDLIPEMVSAGSGKKVWWKCEYGHEWQARIADRTAKEVGCPYCSGRYPIIGKTDLATIHPILAKEWHPTKNGALTPEMVTAGSHQKVWWQCEHKHEWEATINSRTKGNGCPYCSGRLPIPGITDLATTHPEIATEWHPTKNGDLTPEAVSKSSQKKVWWQCGHGHEWKTRVANRTNGSGCPYCSGKKVLPGFNDLATTHPDIAKEWHPTKNGKLTPQKVSKGYAKKVWWQGKCGHEWLATVGHRTKGSGCPYCAGQKISVGFNDLATTHLELIQQWHPTKNGDLTPQDISKGSNKKIWWQCKHGHEWQATVSSRTSKGVGCPYCSNNGTSIPELTLLYYIRKHISSDVIHRYHKLGFEIDIYIPELHIGIEYDGRGYHQHAKKDIIKNKKCFEQGIKLYRVRETGLPELNDSSVDYFYKYRDDTAFSAVISKLLSDISETEINVNVTEDFAEINDFIKHAEIEESLAKHNPELAAEWHPTKNGSLTPEMVSVGSGKKVWWQCEHGHEWKTIIKHRANGRGCPYCAGRKVWIGFNDLATTHPEIASEWHPTQNGKLTPQKVSKGSNKKVRWKCQHGHEWQARIADRTKGNGCPYCSGRHPIPGVTDLATTHPDIAAKWNYAINGDLTPEAVSYSSNKDVWWKCTHCGHEYQRSPNKQTRKNQTPRCPHCKTPVNSPSDSDKIPS